MDYIYSLNTFKTSFQELRTLKNKFSHILKYKQLMVMESRRLVLVLTCLSGSVNRVEFPSLSDPPGVDHLSSMNCDESESSLFTII